MANGKQEVIIHKDPNRDFTKAFCKISGSSLPFITSDRSRRYIIPTASLSDEPNKIVTTNIFCQERSNWKASISSATRFRQLLE
jgi:hypothetical protein